MPLQSTDDIKTGSDLIVTRVNKEKFTLDIVGTVQAVRSARFMLSTNVSPMSLFVLSVLDAGQWWAVRIFMR